MKDSIKSCQHALSDDVIYKEVVVIGNGPSGMVTSFMLAGNVPYLKNVPEDLPIDDMLRARLSNLPPGQSLYETDLMELAEGLEGRSQNPIPLLMDNLLKPCADMGLQADPLVEWRHDVTKQIDHVVLGRGPPGGAWHTFPAGVRTLSPGGWLALPPHAPAAAAAGAARLTARAVAKYCRRYVTACGLQKYFRSGVVVTSVTRVPHAPAGPRCHNDSCPLNANFYVTGYEKSAGRRLQYACARVVVASGGGDRPNALAAHVAPHALHALHAFERAARALAARAARAADCGHAAESGLAAAPAVVVVGSGLSAADGVRLARRGGLRALHVHRAPAAALARLAPAAYPDYCQVYNMMCDGPSGDHHNYTSYPEHVIIDVTPLTGAGQTTTATPDQDADELDEYAITPKRVRMLNLVTNETVDVHASLIGVFIGSKPDLFYLQTNYLNCINMMMDCPKCTDDKTIAQRKIEEKQCFLKNHWHYIKSMLGQSIQSCKSRYLNYTEINGNTDTKCVIPDCNKRGEGKKIEIIPYTPDEKLCQCESVNPYSAGIGFGIDPKKPVDGRNNPIAIDKSSHEILNGPEGMYALGPLTADNFVRFIPGGALAVVAHMHKNKQ